MLGIETPTLCYGDTLTPVNVCRVCVVELEGARTLVPSCSRKAEDGMVVHTDSERVRTLAPPRAGAARLVGRPLDRARRARATSSEYDAKPERFGPDAATRRARGEDRQRPLRARLLEVHPLLQLRRGVRRRPPEHVRDRRRRPRLRRAHLDRARRDAARVGVRLLRQLHRRVPDRRADVDGASTRCGRPARGTRRTRRS